MAPLLLYDLASRDQNRSWSYNPWKTRLALNYKGIDYETRWLEYPEVAPTFQTAGIPPNSDGKTKPYTIPTVKFPDDTYIMDSAKIIVRLEADYPQRPLQADSKLTQTVQELVAEMLPKFAPNLQTKIPYTVLGPVSQAYYFETREKQWGMPISQVAVEKGGEKAWQAGSESLSKIVALLKATEGPFFLGNQVSYADFILAAVIHFSRKAGEDVYERFVSHDRALLELYQACEQWFKRDDH